MAKDFDVPFLGSVPIDPMFIRLIEEGKTPEYPEGTVIEGNDMQTNGPIQEIKDDALLVEKYRSCSLAPIFDGVVKQVVATIEQTNR